MRCALIVFLVVVSARAENVLLLNGAPMAVTPPALTSVPCVILIGQSNAEGAPQGTNSLGALAYGSTNAYLWYYADRATTEYNHWLAPAAPPNTNTWGLELTLATNLNYPQLAVVKVTEDGTTLYGDWCSTGRLYRIATNQWRMAHTHARYAQGWSLSLAAVVWVQGEADSRNVTQANAYAVGMTDLVARVATDFGAAPFIACRIHSSLPTNVYTWASTVRDAQSNAVPATALVDTDGLTLNADSIHFSQAGLISLGNLVGAAIKQQ